MPIVADFLRIFLRNLLLHDRIHLMRKMLLVLLLLLFFVGICFFFFYRSTSSPVLESASDYWFVLHRKSQKEFLYKGIPGKLEKSKRIKTFTVKNGRSGERPTPLPQLVGREYWVLTKKASSDNPETAPYFLRNRGRNL